MLFVGTSPRERLRHCQKAAPPPPVNHTLLGGDCVRRGGKSNRLRNEKRLMTNQSAAFKPSAVFEFCKRVGGAADCPDFTPRTKGVHKGPGHTMWGGSLRLVLAEPHGVAWTKRTTSLGMQWVVNLHPRRNAAEIVSVNRRAPSQLLFPGLVPSFSMRNRSRAQWRRGG